MYKSPVLKLVKFFRTSRDGWKAKYQQAQRENKRLANQTRAVEKSRAHWKQAAQTAKHKNCELERELRELKCAAAHV